MQYLNKLLTTSKIPNEIIEFQNLQQVLKFNYFVRFGLMCVQFEYNAKLKIQFVNIAQIFYIKSSCLKSHSIGALPSAFTIVQKQELNSANCKQIENSTFKIHHGFSLPANTAISSENSLVCHRSPPLTASSQLNYR